MLGLQDPWIITSLLLCLISTAACVFVGVVNWNAND